jgi:urease accessory protein
VPAPLTCFEGARYTQRTEIDLAAGASLVLLETLTSGRAARGERWRFERFDARTRLRVDGRLLLQEAVRLEAGVVPVADRFGAFNAFSVAVLVGPRVARAAEALRESLAGRPAIRGDSVRVAVSPLAGGVVVRAAAAANEPLEELWKTLLAPALAVVAGGDDWRGPW